ncbi:enoyl-CoA hydratase [Mycobacterium botniense]|uniref:Putative enoyl-CoA hydratase echA14 n=1 Tax=Mycobacterium botniense TaxID=84962 RepID=A0A7I9XZX1_9MYCO|nr:enoyl-CoA hydratase [Mycobacterium botniense]GFG75277.1 putative enoyl-CoA hydratase echA14 [Mycobacterium botniense]
MTQADLVLYHVDNRIALITVNDPGRRNAVTAEMSTALRTAVERAETDPDVHAVVVTGAGTAFCAGADLSALGDAAARRRWAPRWAGRRSRAVDEELLRIYEGFMAVGKCRLPTIAAVNGPAVGAGLNLALAADVRIAGPGAVFDARFLKLGLHPGGGATWMMQRAVGPQLARAAMLFGLCLDAESAVRHGLALNLADDPVAAALELAAPAAAAPREIVLATKATMRATASPGWVDSELHERAKRAELGPQAKSIQSPEFAARLAAARRK